MTPRPQFAHPWSSFLPSYQAWNILQTRSLWPAVLWRYFYCNLPPCNPFSDSLPRLFHCHDEVTDDSKHFIMTQKRFRHQSLTRSLRPDVSEIQRGGNWPWLKVAETGGLSEGQMWTRYFQKLIHPLVWLVCVTSWHQQPDCWPGYNRLAVSGTGMATDAKEKVKLLILFRG